MLAEVWGSVRIRVGLAAVVAVALSLSVPPANAAAAPACGPPATTAADMSRQVLCAVNAERKRHRARTLTRRARLSKVAVENSERMERANVFTHAFEGGSVRRILRTGYARGSSEWEVAETIAWVEPGEGAEAAIAAWLASPYHRRAILGRKWRDIGVGTARGAPWPDLRGGYTVTGTFGRRWSPVPSTP